MPLSRRCFLSRALASGLTLAHASRIFAAEFWNAKDPAAWTEDEISVLTTKSPWARAAIPQVRGADDPTGVSNSGPNDRRGGGGKVTETVIVRWESAQPIREALRAPLAAEFDGHYVVSVTNLPMANARRAGRGSETPAVQDVIDRLQNGATLQTKSKPPAEAGIARQTRIGSILFGFAKDSLPLTPGDREIVFRLDTGQLTLAAKFDTKDMMWHGKLAV